MTFLRKLALAALFAFMPAGASAAAPPEIVPGQPTRVWVAGDKPLYVIHAPPGETRVLVYLHGMCGRIDAAESWIHTATREGTLIALRGDKECSNGRARWNTDTEALNERILKALSAVKWARHGELDPNNLVLIGYSQGAARAYRLAQRYPRFYSRLIVGGPPEAPSLEYLGKVRAVAVLGGELETTESMRSGTADLQAAGKLARYFMLPGSKHGDYGPEAEQLMSEVFDWLLRVAP